MMKVRPLSRLLLAKLAAAAAVTDTANFAGLFLQSAGSAPSGLRSQSPTTAITLCTLKSQLTRRADINKKKPEKGLPGSISDMQHL